MINFTNEQNDELFKQMESLNEEQLEAATTINGPLLVLAGAGSGKALKNGSKVQTPNGPINIEDLRVGDEVFNTYGSTSKVQGVFPQGEKQVWEVEFSDGTIIKCCEEHLWSYQTEKKDEPYKNLHTSTLREIYENKELQQMTEWNVYVPTPKPVDYKEKELPFAPYDIGFASSAFTCNILEDQKQYSMSSPKQKNNFIDGFIEAKRKEGDITEDNLVFSTFTEKHKELIEDIFRSLGFVVKTESEESIPFFNKSENKIKNHKNYKLKVTKDKYVQVKAIRPTKEMAPMTCISVDAKDSLFLTDNFIVTHNTKSMTVRIGNMIKSGISPRNILAMTFTNKAAGEMKERLISMVGEEAIEGIWMSTFHSACIKILRRHGHLIGYQKNEKGFATFSIYDPEDSTKLVKQIFKDLNIVGKHKEGAALSYIDTCKNKLWEPKHAAQYYASSEQEQDFSKVYEIYQKELLKNNAIDFGDMIMKTVEVLRDHASAASYWQNKFHYLLIDEFQDSNYAQLQLILLLSSPHFNLFAVGDFRQSIYKFRGSDISIILGFKNMFPTGKVVHLLKNYRSQSNIVNVGNYLIDHNKTEFNKDLQAHHAEGKKVNVVSVGTEFHEAAFAASTIKKAVMSGQRSYKDFAILYRSNAQSRIIEDVFRNQFIPTKMVNGTGFYQREEIKDIVSYLRVLYNVKDSVALLRVMNKPTRGIGKATQGKLETFAKDNDVSLFAALQRIDNIDGISKRSIMPIKNFFALMKSIKEDEHKFKTKSRFVEYVIQVTGLQKLYTGTTSELMEKEENLKEFVTLIAEFEATYPEKTLEDFIMEMSLSSSQVEESQEDAVKMMTIHASKGLEFPVVFCVAWSETIFPGFRAVSKEDIEEERRVAYVAITRAEEELYITHADTRRQMNGSMQKYEPSRFLSELPSELVHEMELFKHGEKKVKETLAIKEKTSSMGIDVSTIKDFDALSPEDKFRLLMEK